MDVEDVAHRRALVRRHGSASVQPGPVRELALRTEEREYGDGDHEGSQAADPLAARPEEAPSVVGRVGCHGPEGGGREPGGRVGHGIDDRARRPDQQVQDRDHPNQEQEAGGGTTQDIGVPDPLGWADPAEQERGGQAGQSTEGQEEHGVVAVAEHVGQSRGGGQEREEPRGNNHGCCSGGRPRCPGRLRRPRRPEPGQDGADHPTSRVTRTGRRGVAPSWVGSPR